MGFRGEKVIRANELILGGVNYVSFGLSEVEEAKLVECFTKTNIPTYQRWRARMDEV